MLFRNITLRGFGNTLSPTIPQTTCRSLSTVLNSECTDIYMSIFRVEWVFVTLLLHLFIVRAIWHWLTWLYTAPILCTDNYFWQFFPHVKMLNYLTWCFLALICLSSLPTFPLFRHFPVLLLSWISKEYCHFEMQLTSSVFEYISPKLSALYILTSEGYIFFQIRNI